MMSFQEILSIMEAMRGAAQLLRSKGVPEARREAASLLTFTLNRDRAFLLTHPEHLLTAEEALRFRAAVERRAAGEPPQYITGRQEFYGLEFEVTPDVLIPRPETELLVETALALLDRTERQHRVCDVGTGSGCIAVCILHQRESVSEATGLDISLRALRVASRNAVRHGVHGRLKLVASDCFAAIDLSEPRFSMIVSNPPYVSEAALEGLQREVRDHEPRVALTPGTDGLRIIRRLLEDAPRLLPTGGHLLMEIGFDQHEAVRELLDRSVWRLLDIHRDLQGIPRIVTLRKL